MPLRGSHSIIHPPVYGTPHESCNLLGVNLRGSGHDLCNWAANLRSRRPNLRNPGSNLRSPSPNLRTGVLKEALCKALECVRHVLKSPEYQGNQRCHPTRREPAFTTPMRRFVTRLRRFTRGLHKFIFRLRKPFTEPHGKRGKWQPTGTPAPRQGKTFASLCDEVSVRAVEMSPLLRVESNRNYPPMPLRAAPPAPRADKADANQRRRGGAGTDSRYRPLPVVGMWVTYVCVGHLVLMDSSRRGRTSMLVICTSGVASTTHAIASATLAGSMTSS